MINFLPLIDLWSNSAQIYKWSLYVHFLLNRKKITQGKWKFNIYNGSPEHTSILFRADYCQIFPSAFFFYLSLRDIYNSEEYISLPRSSLVSTVRKMLKISLQLTLGIWFCQGPEHTNRPWCPWPSSPELPSHPAYEPGAPSELILSAYCSIFSNTVVVSIPCFTSLMDLGLVL